MRVIEMTAEFGTVRDAREFVAEYLTDGAASSSNVKQAGKVVTWTATTDSEYYVWDLTENAGCIGTYGRYVAIVNGRRAPRSY